MEGRWQSRNDCGILLKEERVGLWEEKCEPFRQREKPTRHGLM